jgi:hypothetical protein
MAILYYDLKPIVVEDFERRHPSMMWFVALASAAR